jgi:DNA-directed RNA polymerase specialized sigma24 family protein
MATTEAFATTSAEFTTELLSRLGSNKAESQAELAARASRIIEMHFFGGLSFEEMGLALDVSARTVNRDWRIARAWVRGELSAGA